MITITTTRTITIIIIIIAIIIESTLRSLIAITTVTTT